MSDGTACDMLCQYCGRPVIGTMVWGAQGPYHPECTAPPIYRSGEPPIEIDHSKRTVALRLLVEKWRKLAVYAEIAGDTKSAMVYRECAKELEDIISQ